MAAAAAVMIFSCAGCKSSEPAMLESYALGTVCNQTVYNGDESVVKEGERILFDIEARMSRYRDESEVDKINENTTPQEASADTAKVIRTANRVSVLSEGAFDISMGILAAEWDITNHPHVPAPEVIAEELKHVDYTQIAIDGNTVRTPEGMILDLGGVAKGYAADAMAKMYREKGVESGLINLGGNIYAVGTKPDGSDFKIGIADPENSTDYFAVVSISDTALVTSGADERNGQ